VLARLGLHAERFWLAVGTVEPRKNYGTLIEAYARLVAGHRETKPLVVGQAGWKETPIGHRVREIGLDDMVIAPGFLPDDELAALYRTAFALVYPSYYEGFGLPVVEAMGCGAPVIASNSSSLPEVVGSAGLLVSPGDAEALASAMGQLTTDESLRARLKEASPRQAARFSWREAARRTLDLYADALAKTGRNPLVA
jgi:glycosyltransferase involved in cell wall biosynthesis